MRLQLALNVRNIEEAVDYYAKLFGVQPHKLRPGYANFVIEQPPLKLVLFENPDADERINHLGVEVFAQEEVEAAFQRLEPVGLVEAVQRDETCCYATQGKVWSREPQGLRWEWYRITDHPKGWRVADQTDQYRLAFLGGAVVNSIVVLLFLGMRSPIQKPGFR